MWEGLSPPYATIVADPPWRYATPGALGGKKEWIKITVADKYSTMRAEDIAGLPVSSLAADNAHLYLWTTNAFLVEAHKIAVAWGFRPVTMLTWVKVYQDDPTRVSMKVGYYFRGATEHALFCVKGSLPSQTEDAIPTAHLWPRGAHSEKPQAFLDLVERVSPGPYVELFARAPRLGWDSWGLGYESRVS